VQSDIGLCVTVHSGSMMTQVCFCISMVLVATTLGHTEGFIFGRFSHFLSSSSYTPPKRAIVRIIPGGDKNVSGHLSLTSVSHPQKAVLIQGTVYGLKPGKHGFHVHMKGELGNQCKDAGGHFNPAGVDHAGPLDSERHAGDLGNILTPDHGYSTQISILDGVISLGDGGEADIAGRGIVVHAGEDDLGRGGDAGSKKTGNAGGRLACGIIELIE